MRSAGRAGDWKKAKEMLEAIVHDRSFAVAGDIALAYPTIRDY